MVTPLRCAGCGATHAWDGGILVLGRPGHPTDYPSSFHALLAAAEEEHFWFAARNRVILATMRRTIGNLRDRSVLDIGCGTGYVMAALERAGMRACGLEMNLEGLRHARARTNGWLIGQDAAEIPFVDEFDVAMLCDVIEHAADDLALLRAAARALKHQGCLVVTVPAHPGLWSPIDEASGHKRRYTRRGLDDLLEHAGLHRRQVRYFNTLLVPVLALQRLLLRRRSISTETERLELIRDAVRVPRAPLNRLLEVAAVADLALGRLAPPFGTSLIAVGARR
jgi:SAM-dependent methyltransferase